MMIAFLISQVHNKSFNLMLLTSDSYKIKCGKICKIDTTSTNNGKATTNTYHILTTSRTNVAERIDTYS